MDKAVGMESVQRTAQQEISRDAFFDREQAVRAWIARKESVCPYAPGLARFVELPEIDGMSMDHVYWFAKELNAFYKDKQNGKRVGRWMLLPNREWQSHEEAHEFSERVFWLLNAAYFHLADDKRSMKKAMKCEIEGYTRGHKSEILNPVVGHLPKPGNERVPSKSLFYSALSPLYRSKKFYRYAPSSIIPLVYASEFQTLKRNHPTVTERVTFEMAYGGLYEVFGDDLELDLTAFRKELPAWGAIVDRCAEIMRASRLGLPSSSPHVKGCQASNLGVFRMGSPKLVQAFFDKYGEQLPILTRLVQYQKAAPKYVIASCFAGSGLYTIPDYASH